MTHSTSIDDPSSAPPPSRPLAMHWSAVGAVLLLVPLLLLALPLPPTKGKWAIHKQDWVLIASIVMALISAALYFARTRLFPHRSIWPLIVLAASLLVASNVVWNKAFRDYCAKHPAYRREDFRKAMVTTLHWPVYGRYDNAIARYDPAKKRYSFATLPFVLLSSIIAAAWFFWARRKRLDEPWSAGAFAVLIVFQIAMTLSFAMCEQPNRLSETTSGYGEFAKDMRSFKGIRDTLANYTQRMPKLEWYGQHYPPGNLLLLKLEKGLHLPGMTEALVILLTSLAVIPLYGLARELNLSSTASSAAVLLFTASTSVLILCTINTTSLLLLPATICLWMLIKSLRTGSPIAAAVLGVTFFVYMMFSFSAAILGVLMALVTAVARGRGLVTWSNVIRTALIAGVALLVVIVWTREKTHFNLIECFIAGIRGHHEQQGNGGFDDPARYLLRSTGNVIAYLLSTVPLCVLAAGALRRGHGGSDHTRLARVVFWSLAITIGIAGFSGLFYLETERIWIFLTPFVALAAGYETACRGESEARGLTVAVFLLVLVISCSQEFLFMHFR